MKRFALALFALVSTSQALAESPKLLFRDCEKSATEAACLDQAIKSSPAMNQSFYTGKPGERPMIFNAIYSKNPTLHLMSEGGEGGTIFKNFLAIYPVEATEGSGYKLAAFEIQLVVDLEDVAPTSRVVNRAVSLESIKLVGERGEEN